MPHVTPDVPVKGSVLISGVGAPRGLGAAAARVFAAAGHPVLLAGRSGDKLEEAAESVRSVGGTAVVEIGDVSDPRDVDRFVRSAEALGGLSVAIHNAGGNRPAPFLDVDPNDFEEHWRTHAFGGFLLARTTIPRFLAQRCGTLIFTGATGSLRGSARFSPFASAKGALRLLAQSLAREFGQQGIHVAHVIVDGVIDGDRARTAFGDVDQRFGEDGMLDPEEIARTYLLLHGQHRSAWTHELDLRPWSERF